MSSTIEDRVILLLKYKSSEQPSKHGFWERLSELTEIASKRWRNVYARDQRVTSDMLESLAKQFPNYAFWLVTGITDAVNGHVAPFNAQTFPERLYGESNMSNLYFKQSLALSDTLLNKSGLNFGDDNARLNAYQRTKPFAHWWESNLCEIAYGISKTEEYKDLQNTFSQREQERIKALNYITQPEERPWIKKQSESQLQQDSFAGIDPRTQHQDSWDLYYRSIDRKATDT